MKDNPWEVLPEKFLEKIEKIIPRKDLESVLRSFSEKKPSTFRTNQLKISTEDLIKELTRLNVKFERVPWYTDAFILLEPSQREFQETELYKNGFLYIQSLSSMIPPLILDPKEGELICDLTAAPGSKTTQMASLMGNTGKIIANDRSRVRLYKLEANIKLQGVTNTTITYADGQTFWKKYPEYFDKTLVDAPCSLEGRFYSEYPKSFRDWTPGKVKKLSQLQKYLLRSAISSTKPGGIIVYSTCTLSPEENEEVIDWVLKKEGSSIELEDIDLQIDGRVEPIISWKKDLDPQIKKTFRILPSNKMEGFFIAKIRKLKSTLGNVSL